MRLFGRAGETSAPRRHVVQSLELDAALRAEPSVSEIEWFVTDSNGQELDHAPHPA
jgi:hypothetical protein